MVPPEIMRPRKRNLDPPKTLFSLEICRRLDAIRSKKSLGLHHAPLSFPGNNYIVHVDKESRCSRVRIPPFKILLGIRTLALAYKFPL